MDHDPFLTEILRDLRWVRTHFGKKAKVSLHQEAWRMLAEAFHDGLYALRPTKGNQAVKFSRQR